MLKNPDKIPSGLYIEDQNRRRLTEKTGRPAQYTPPCMDHYPYPYKHDLIYLAMAAARQGQIRWAVEDFFAVFEGMNPNTGFIPNQRFPHGLRLYDPEPLTFMHPRKQSDYTQPPLEAKGAAEIFDAAKRQGDEAEGRFFLEEVYSKLTKSYDYYVDCDRQNSSDDPLIGVIHGHETGRDSDPTFDFTKWRLPRNGPDTPPWKDILNSGLDYAGAMTLNVKNRMKNWDVNRIREHFWVNDIMFNCMYADNLRILSNIAEYLGKTEDAKRYRELSAKVFERISTEMWDPDARDGDGAFYALDKDGDKIREISISNLFPLLNPNLPENQLASLITLIQKSFNTPYQLPTVATDSSNYDPEYQGKGIMWRGPIWLWMNDGIAEGLERQASRTDTSPYLQVECAAIAAKIRRDSAFLCQSPFETKSPNTGGGQRQYPFSGNTIGHVAMYQSVLIG